MDLFWRKGFYATPIASILAEARANSGSLYYFFSSKDDLLIAVLEAYRENMDAWLLEPAWRDVQDPLDRIFSLLNRYRDLIVTMDCTYGCPIGSLALELHDPAPRIRELLAQTFKAWTEAVAGNLELAADRLPPGTNVTALAELILSTMEGGVMQARIHRDVGYFDRVVDQLRPLLGMEIHMQGVQK